jgi:hypothetical protein
MGRRRRTKRAVQNTPADDVQLIADFVRRLRRVALHPLALNYQGGDDIASLPGAYLRMLMEAGGTFLLRPDRSATGFFDIKERFRAAVGVFSHMAVVALDTLHYINHLVTLGLLELPVGTFSDSVVVTDREYVQQVFFFATEVGADLSVLDAEMPENLRPALQMAKKMMGKSEN